MSSERTEKYTKKPVSIPVDTWATIEKLAKSSGMPPTTWCRLCLVEMAASGTIWIQSYVRQETAKKEPPLTVASKRKQSPPKKA